MKILIIKNGKVSINKEKNNLKKYYEKDIVEKFGFNKIDIDFEEIETDYKISKYVNYGGKNNLGKKFFTVFPIRKELRKIIKKDNKFDIVIFCYESPKFWLNYIRKLNYYMAPNVSSPLYNVKGKTTQLVEMPHIHEKHAWKHELIHCMNNLLKLKDFMDLDEKGRKYYNNNKPLIKESNYYNSLKTIDKIVKAGEKKVYKYFSEDEVSKFQLTEKMWEMLDVARGFSGIPYKITSGKRSPKENKRIGGAKKSYHLQGLAVDIRAKGEGNKHKIIIGLAKAGFTGIEKADLHIHADLRETPYYWIGHSK